MFDFEVAFFLYKMSRINEIFCDSKYKARAYYSAAMALDAHDTYVQKMYKEQSLQSIPYVGDKIEKCIIEIIETGELQELRKNEEQFGIKDYSLVLNHGLPVDLIRKLWKMSICNVKDLRDACSVKMLDDVLSKGELTKVTNFLQDYSGVAGRYLKAYGDCLGNELIEFLRDINKIQMAEFYGEMMSEHEKIQQIEIVFSYSGNWDYLLKKIREFQRIKGVCGKRYAEITGQTKFGIPFRLLYQTADLGGRIIKESCEIPDNVICVEDIRGDLHAHTKWTDGIHAIEQMLQEAEVRGYEYQAITDHSISLRMAHGLSESQALSQIQEVRECEKRSHVKVLAGIEVDILEDGSLDFCDAVLSQFDFVIAAIHSHMKQSAPEMETRLRKALSNPYVNILAHPTGRLLGRPGMLFSSREAYELNVLSIIELCKEYHVVMEVNCFPERLDLDASNALLAVKNGVKLSLGTDAHSLAHLRNIEYGVKMLRSAGIKADMVLNTYSYDELVDFFATQKEKNQDIVEPVVFTYTKDFQYYFRNNQEILQGKRSVIGIDLTGNEEKPSGWAYMIGEHVECRRIKTDRELIDAVLDLKPDIVSIDSPLAYPKGRCCFRKDCECSKYGIMRKSERLLRHFGITVYPCLIDSMVNLTTRGMRLARKLRTLGFTVIESYPGVAQDVLMIPRKGKTQEQFMHLKQGLASFGIKGDLLTNCEISHDEVDAITSALVGYFYLNGQYVGLGNEDEDYLIVPRIQEELLQRHIVIGLCGETGAGKTTVAQYLRFKYGLKYFRYSQIIAEKYKVQDKEELQKIGARIAENEQEQRGLTRFMIDKMEPESGYVIDGLRHEEDYDELKKQFGDDFVFIYIDCKFKNRCMRYQKMNFNQVSEEAFRNINDHIAEKEIGMLQYRTDYRVDNNKGFKDLWCQVDDIVKRESGGKY